MKKLLLLLVLLGLILTSCKKETLEEKVKANTFVLNGDVYDIESCMVHKYVDDYQTTLTLKATEDKGYLYFYFKNNFLIGNNYIYSKDSNNDINRNDCLLLMNNGYDYNTIESVITDYVKVIGSVYIMEFSPDNVSGYGEINNEGVSIKYNFNLLNVYFININTPN